MHLILGLTVLVAVIVYLLRGKRAAAAGLQCHWQPTGAITGRLRQFRCLSCGVEAHSQRPTGPQDCKRGFRAPGL